MNGGRGSGALAQAFPEIGIDWRDASFAFGLTVLDMALSQRQLFWMVAIIGCIIGTLACNSVGGRGAI